VKDYHINIFWSDEDNAYVADIPDLASCSAIGATPEEALAELAIARAAWIEAAHESGRPVPSPSYRPLIYQIST
jgi:predicted RNase H-like HicB family nuclease